MITHLHHINFIVCNLNEAVERYTSVFELDDFIFDTLDQRGVKTARTKIGETWLVLVEPVDEHGLPAQHLKEFGEGFFLLSLATDNFDQHFEQLKSQSNNASSYKQPKSRKGLASWTVSDLPISAFFGAQLQLTQEELVSEGQATQH
jgi:methylmalonyl-CoA/ethylmalonyl-CoA epimerase